MGYESLTVRDSEAVRPPDGWMLPHFLNDQNEMMKL